MIIDVKFTKAQIGICYLVFSSSEDQSETIETTEVKTKLELKKCMFCQKDK